MAPHRIPYLASVRHESGPFNPDTPGRTASPGSRTSSRTSSDVTEARSESLRWMSLAVNPGESVGTRKPRIPSSVLAHTTARSAIPPLVIHIFVPESTQSSPSLRAAVRIRPGSEPTSGSVRPKHPMTSPLAIAGSHRSSLLLGAEAVDREHAERALDRDEGPEAAVGVLELQAREPVRDGAGARAPVALEVHAEEAEVGEPLADREGELAPLEPIAHPGQDLLGREGPDRALDLPLLLREEVGDVQVVERIGSAGHDGPLA